MYTLFTKGKALQNPGRLYQRPSVADPSTRGVNPSSAELRRIGLAANHIGQRNVQANCTVRHGFGAQDEDSDFKAESMHSRPSHPELLDGEEGIILPQFSKPPPGWVKCYFPTSSVDPTKSLEENWERAADMMLSCSMSSVDEDVLHFSPDKINRHDIWTLTDQPGIDMFSAGVSSWSCLKRVYVILFGVGERETEGIYSLRAFRDDGLPQETIIAFESEEDAQRYAGLLEATMDHVPNVCSIPARELLDFCSDQGYNCRLEPTGSLLIPPDYNVHITDWERSLRLREGRWAVLEEEPERSSAGHFRLNSASGSTAIANVAAKPGLNSSALARYTGFSESDLQNIRAKLEKLLPPGP